MRRKMQRATAGGSALVERCRSAALRLLRANLTGDGLLAASPTPKARARNYHRVFARDAGFCAVAMARSGDRELVAGARASLRTLARHQAANGQIPNFVTAAGEGGDFWYVGCIDATLWWLIAVKQLALHAPNLGFGRELEPAVRRALGWIACQEHPKLQLVTQNEASDWADIMPRSGFVLYSNALWHYVKKLYDLPGQDETRRHFNRLFHPFSGGSAGYRRLRLLNQYVRRRARDKGLYLSFVNFSFWGEEGDVLGNLMSVVLGPASDARARAIARRLEREQVAEPVSVRCVLAPIRQRSPHWRDYMARHSQNYAHQYHNGGCWPFVGGFWVMVLAALGETEKARAALEGLARANAINDWQFNEWFHGRTGEPMGMPGQSWNAASFLLAADSLGGRIF